MKIYEDEYATFQYDEKNNRVIHSWNKSFDCIEVFKSSLMRFRGYCNQYEASQVLVYQKHFTIKLTDEIHLWMEENVNIPIIESGLKKCAFVVGEDALAQIKVIQAFDNIQSSLNHNHFASECEAKKWLGESGKITPKKDDSFVKVIFEGVNEEGNSVFTIVTSSFRLKGCLKSLESVSSDLLFREHYRKKFERLSPREVEILKLCAARIKHKEIGERLFISLHTVRTHWRNIKIKLDIGDDNDASNIVRVLT